MSHHDTIVIGLGAVGAAALYQLARRGASVLGIDRFAPPHDQGSSHGQTRITRLAIGEGDEYVPIVRRSHEIWRELESATGRGIFTSTGGLVLAPRDRVAAHHGKPDFVRRTIASAVRNGIRHEVLDAQDIERRFPQFKLRGNEIGYFEPEAGFVRPEEAISAQLGLAQVHGATVQVNETVTGIQQRGYGLEVTTNKGRYGAGQVVLAAGPWLPGFLAHEVPSTWHRDVAAYRQVMHWFDTGAASAQFAPANFPIFIWMFGDEQEDYMYGFPSSDAGAPALKVATEQYGATTTPATVEREVPAAESDAMLSVVKDRFHAPGARVADAKACLYTVTPDRQFLVDALPGLPGVLVASACSGHGFKHSAGIGEALAERVLGHKQSLDLSAFSHARLQQAAKDTFVVK